MKVAFHNEYKDFDGDTMAVFTVDSIEGIMESYLLSIENNLLSRKDFGINPQILPYQDNALGIWLMNHENAF